MTYAADLVARLAERGITVEDADGDVLAVAAAVAAVAGMGRIPGLSVRVTDAESLLRFLTTMVEVGTLNAAVAR